VNTTSRIALVAVAVLGLVGVAAGGVFYPVNRRLAEAQADLHSAQVTAKAAVLRADVAQITSDSLRAAASHALAARDAALALATKQEARGAALADNFHTAAKASADTCAGLVEVAEHIFAVKDSTIASLHVALDSATSAAQGFKRSSDSLRVALTDLRASTVKLDASATRLEHAAKPSLLSRLGHLLPRPGVGVAAGIDQLGQPHFVTGITLGWSR